MLTPAERLEVEERAEKYREDQPGRLLRKEEALRTTVGRGLLFITNSLIRLRQPPTTTITQLQSALKMAFLSVFKGLCISRG